MIVEYKFFIIKCVCVCFLMKHLFNKCSISSVLRGKSVILVCCLPGGRIQQTISLLNKEPAVPREGAGGELEQ